MRRLTGILPFLFFISSCVTMDEERVQKDRQPEQPVAVEPYTEKVDLRELQQNLQMVKNQHDLGLDERSFNTCDVAAGYSRTNNCRIKVFSVLPIQILCRNSRGTVEAVNDYELRPLVSDSIKWQIAGYEGGSRSSRSGHLQIRLVSNKGIYRQKLTLFKDKKYLRLRVSSAERIIVPADWCS